MTAPAPVDYGVLASVIKDLMDRHPIASPESAAAMKVILDRYEGAIITGHMHPHVHTIDGLDLKQTADHVLEITIRASPCPVVFEGGLKVETPMWDGEQRLIDEAYVPRCPECKVNKHGNCNGETWDHAADEAVPCPCDMEGHPS